MIDRGRASWLLASGGLVGVLVTAWSFWVLLTTPVTELVWWADACVFLSGPVGFAGMLIARPVPRIRFPYALGLSAAAIWTLLWGLILTGAA